MQFIKLFFPTFIVTFCLDMIWLGFIAKSLYQTNLGHLLKKTNDVFTPNWQAAIIVYLAITLGIIYFAVPKADNSYLLGLFWGALLGLVIYGVYDFTNYSILANWPLNITLIDCIWGMVLCGLTTASAIFFQRILNG